MKIPPCKRRNTSKPPIFGLTVHFRIQKEVEHHQKPTVVKFNEGFFFVFSKPRSHGGVLPWIQHRKNAPVKFQPDLHWACFSCVGHGRMASTASHSRCLQAHVTDTRASGEMGVAVCIACSRSFVPSLNKTDLQPSWSCCRSVVAKSTCFDHLYI